MVIGGVDLPENPPEYPNELNGDASLISFVVRLWKEELSEEDQTGWRGHITMIPEGRRHYFTNISEISEFIIAHLAMPK